MITGACDVEIHARKINFTLNLSSDNDGISNLGGGEQRL